MKFSITIPAFKTNYLRDAIESCLSQTFSDFELIIVDDASPYDIKGVVVPYLTDSRVRYYRNEKNCGAEHVVDNWNICLGYCTGDWVICMGDDDMLMPNCLEEYSKAISNNPQYDVFHGRVRQIDEHGALIKILPDRAEHESAYANIIHRLEGRHQYIGDFCYRIRRLRHEGGYYNLPYAWGSDDITAYILGCPNGVGNINTPIFCYRINSMSISSSGNELKKLQALLLVDKWLHDFVNIQNPKTELEIEELNEIKRQIPKATSKTQGYVIIPSMLKNPFTFFKWFMVGAKYGLTKATVIKSIIRYNIYR